MTTPTPTKLTCSRKQDVIEEEEVEIWLYGHLRWNNYEDE